VRRQRKSYEDRLGLADLRAGIALASALEELEAATSEGEAIHAELDREMERLSKLRSKAQVVTVTAGEWADNLRGALHG
jgi:hypothetical protein